MVLTRVKTEFPFKTIACPRTAAFDVRDSLRDQLQIVLPVRRLAEEAAGFRREVRIGSAKNLRSAKQFVTKAPASGMRCCQNAFCILCSRPNQMQRRA